MRGSRTKLIVSCASACVVFVAACGGSAPPPRHADDEASEYEAEDDMTVTESRSDEGGPRTTTADDADRGANHGDNAAGAAKDEPPEPEFKDGMSVDEAIKAVPVGVERMNLDEETLGKPLQNMDVYKPCKPTPSQHVKMRIAIWNGKAVGMDITATPKNKKFEDCIRQVLSGVTWKDKVKSLNTIEYGF